MLPLTEPTSAAASAALSAQSLFDYLYFHVVPSPGSVRTGQQRAASEPRPLPAGQVSRISAPWLTRFAPQPQPDFAALRSQFRQLLAQAVRDERAQDTGGGKAGCFLSGGTDSSTVAGMLKQEEGVAATYSIGFHAEGYDEMAYARLAAKHFGCDHHEYYVTPDDLVAAIPQVAASYDQPFGNSSALPAYYCAKMAREDGVTRILAGDGGDELFGGNTRYAKQRVFGWYSQMPEPLRSAVLEPLLLHTPLGALPGLKKGRSYIEQARVPLPARMETYNLLLRLGPAQVLEPAFLAQVNQQAPAQQQQQVWDRIRAANPTASELNIALAFDWRYTLAESDLPKVKGTCALAGIDVGFPMLSEALIDFSTTLPDNYKLKGLKLRWFFKEALRGFLPDEILLKKKQGFGLPFGVWATQHAGLRALAEDSLGSLGTRGIVRPGFMHALLKHQLPQHPGYYGEVVWILMMLEQWLRVHAPSARLS